MSPQPDTAGPGSQRRSRGPAPSDRAEEPVLYEVTEHVATITLNRPHRRNAISMPMLRALGDALTRADESSGVRAIVLTGAGKGFCAGLDIKDAMAGTGIGSGGGGGAASALTNTRSLPTSILFEIDTPVIAAVNGAAAGYGLDLALGCDMRILGESSRLLPGFAKRGVVPESGGTWYLPRLVGWARAAEIGFLGRDLDAARSLELGLANAVVPDGRLLDETRAWAAEVAANAPLAVRAMKRLYRHGLTEDFPAHTHHVLLQTMQLFGTQDFVEGISSFAEGREPRFDGR
jgi:enoyl-CoA hydratase/carnithine racemase